MTETNKIEQINIKDKIVTWKKAHLKTSYRKGCKLKKKNKEKTKKRIAYNTSFINLSFFLPSVTFWRTKNRFLIRILN